MFFLQSIIDGSTLPCKISCTTISNPFKELCSFAYQYDLRASLHAFHPGKRVQKYSLQPSNPNFLTRFFVRFLRKTRKNLSRCTLDKNLFFKFNKNTFEHLLDTHLILNRKACDKILHTPPKKNR